MACSIIQKIDSKECVGNSLVKINSNFTGLESAVCDLQAASFNVPIGGVIMYSGGSSNFDENGRGKADTDVYLYGLCNGNTYNDIASPDLRDKFVVGAGRQYTLGATGGLSAVPLAVKDLPAHSHTYTDQMVYGKNSKDADAGSKDTNFEGVTSTLSKTTGNTGLGHAHENRPPFYSLYYIIKVG